MIRGRVYPQARSSNEPPITGKPRITVTVSNITEPSGSLEVDAVVDTGFTAHLTLPPATITELNPRYRGKWRVELANGVETELDVYVVLVSWQGQARATPVFASDSEPLVGMALLWGSRLTVDAWEGGDVIIEEVPPEPPA